MLLYGLRAGDALSVDPPTTGVVNSAIDLFSVAIALHSPKIQESSVEQIATFLTSPSLQRNPGRRAALVVNISVALLHALKVAVKETDFVAGKLNPSTDKILQELVQVSNGNGQDWLLTAANSIRNLSLTRTLLFAPLVSRHWAVSATVLAILAPMRKSTGSSIPLLRTGSRMLALDAPRRWDASIPKSAEWQLDCISRPLSVC